MSPATWEFPWWTTVETIFLHRGCCVPSTWCSGRVCWSPACPARPSRHADSHSPNKCASLVALYCSGHSPYRNLCSSWLWLTSMKTNERSLSSRRPSWTRYRSRRKLRTNAIGLSHHPITTITINNTTNPNNNNDDDEWPPVGAAMPSKSVSDIPDGTPKNVSSDPLQQQMKQPLDTISHKQIMAGLSNNCNAKDPYQNNKLTWPEQRRSNTRKRTTINHCFLWLLQQRQRTKKK